MTCRAADARQIAAWGWLCDDAQDPRLDETRTQPSGSAARLLVPADLGNLSRRKPATCGAVYHGIQCQKQHGLPALPPLHMAPRIGPHLADGLLHTQPTPPASNRESAMTRESGVPSGWHADQAATPPRTLHSTQPSFVPRDIDPRQLAAAVGCEAGDAPPPPVGQPVFIQIGLSGLTLMLITLHRTLACSNPSTPRRKC